MNAFSRGFFFFIFVVGILPGLIAWDYMYSGYVLALIYGDLLGLFIVAFVLPVIAGYINQYLHHSGSSGQVG